MIVKSSGVRPIFEKVDLTIINTFVRQGWGAKILVFYSFSQAGEKFGLLYKPFESDYTGKRNKTPF